MENRGEAHNKGLWRLSKWGRKAESGQEGNTLVPSLRRNAEEDLETANDKKAQILGESSFRLVAGLTYQILTQHVSTTGSR